MSEGTKRKTGLTANAVKHARPRDKDYKLSDRDGLYLLINTAFLSTHDDVFCSIQARSSQWIMDGVVTRRLDLGLVEPGLNNPYLTVEPVLEHPQVCIMPMDHPLGKKRVIEPTDLHQIPFVSLNPDSHPGHQLATMFEKYRVQPQISLVANLTTTLCEFVAAGHGLPAPSFSN